MKKRLFCFFVICIALSLAGCIRVEQRQEPQDEWISVSWEKRYASLRELTLESELIAIATVQEAVPVPEAALPSTSFTMKFHTLLWGEPLSGTFTIVMTGGKKEDGSLLQVTDDPLMKTGEQYLLFCTENKDGSFTVLGGPQGRFRYQNNTFTPVYEPDSGLLMPRQADADTINAQIISYLTTA